MEDLFREVSRKKYIPKTPIIQHIDTNVFPKNTPRLLRSTSTRYLPPNLRSNETIYTSARASASNIKEEETSSEMTKNEFTHLADQMAKLTTVLKETL